MFGMTANYKTICVTGGAGFIGSHLVDRLLDENFEVIAIDNLSNGKLENIKHNLDKENFRLMKCDIADLKSVKHSIEGVDAIFHEAALTSVEMSIRRPILTNNINVTGTLNLLEAALASKVKRFVFASSVAVYGDVCPPQKEDMPTRPISPYAVSKLAAENYVKVFHDVYGLETVCLRYFNVYGPRQRGDSSYGGVITKFIQRLLRNESLLIYGDGNQSRDFIHVQDVVEANMLALENEEADGEILNVGTGKSTSINELARMLLELMNKNCGKIVHARAKRGDIRYSCADTTKAKKIIGLNPKYTLEDELRKLVEWHTKIKGLYSK